VNAPATLEESKMSFNVTWIIGVLGTMVLPFDGTDLETEKGCVANKKEYGCISRTPVFDNNAVETVTVYVVFWRSLAVGLKLKPDAPSTNTKVPGVLGETENAWRTLPVSIGTVKFRAIEEFRATPLEPFVGFADTMRNVYVVNEAENPACI
jgi:hypothetical protein